MAFSCLEGWGEVGLQPYLPSTAGGEILSLIDNWLPAIASPLLAQAPSLTLLQEQASLLATSPCSLVRSCPFLDR